MATTDGAEAKLSGGSPSAGDDRNASPETVFWSGAGASMPAQLGCDRIKRKLGGGGMGAVYLVENTDLQREEALKVPRFESGGDPVVRERFLREAPSAARYFLTLHYLPGKPLSAFTNHAHSPRQAIEIVKKLAQALEHAHAP